MQSCGLKLLRSRYVIILGLFHIQKYSRISYSATAGYLRTRIKRNLCAYFLIYVFIFRYSEKLSRDYTVPLRELSCTTGAGFNQVRICYSCYIIEFHYKSHVLISADQVVHYRVPLITLPAVYPFPNFPPSTPQSICISEPPSICPSLPFQETTSQSSLT